MPEPPINNQTDAAFAPVYAAIAARPDDQNMDKDDLTSAVQTIEAEAQQGAANANANKLTRWLHSLAALAPRISSV